MPESFDTKTIHVSEAERAVIVDGERYDCIPADREMPRSLSWVPEVKGWPGYRENDDGTGRGFKEFAPLEPFVALWKAAKDAADTDKAVAKAHAEARERRAAAEAEARKAAHEAEVARIEREIAVAQPMNEALGALAASDHEIIKAMEAEALARGVIDPKLVADRQAWRAKVKALRAKS